MKLPIRFVLQIAVAGLLALTGCGKGTPDPTAGNKAFSNGDYTRAVTEYRKEFGDLPGNPTVAARMAIGNLLTSKHKEFIRTYNRHLEISGKLSNFQASQAALRVLESSKFGKVPKSNSRNLFMVWQDVPFLMKIWLFNQVTNRVTAGAKTPRQKADLLFDWVTTNIRSNTDPVEGDPPAGPWAILMRGYGVCDRTAWTFVTLAQQAGLNANIIYLRDPDDPKKTSPHTIATVLINGKWILFDTYGGFQLTDKAGKALDMDAVLDNPESLDPYLAINERYPIQAKYFKKATVYLTLNPAAILPRMRLLGQTMSQELSSASSLPILHQSLGREFLTLIDPAGKAKADGGKGYSFPHVFEKHKYEADIWPYPFKLAREEKPGFEYFRGLPKKLAENKLYRETRFHHVLGNYDKAVKAYDSLISEGGAVKEPSLFYKGLCLLDSGKLGEASKALEIYLKEYSKGLWLNQARFVLGKIHLKTDDRDKAAEFLNQVEGPRKLGARLSLLRSDREPRKEQPEKPEHPDSENEEKQEAPSPEKPEEGEPAK